jgi:hypothetical protein
VIWAELTLLDRWLVCADRSCTIEDHLKPIQIPPESLVEAVTKVSYVMPNLPICKIEPNNPCAVPEGMKAAFGAFCNVDNKAERVVATAVGHIHPSA